MFIFTILFSFFIISSQAKAETLVPLDSFTLKDFSDYLFSGDAILMVFFASWVLFVCFFPQRKPNKF